MRVFREDNAEGYDTYQLDWLNEAWEANYTDIDPDSDAGKHLRESLFKALEAAESDIIFVDRAPTDPDPAGHGEKRAPWICKNCPMVGGTDWDYGNKHRFQTHKWYEDRMRSGEDLAPKRRKSAEKKKKSRQAS